MLIKTIFLTGELRDGRGKRTPIIILIIIIIIINFPNIIVKYCLEKFPNKLNLSFNNLYLFVVGQNTVLSIHY